MKRAEIIDEIKNKCLIVQGRIRAVGISAEAGEYIKANRNEVLAGLLKFGAIDLPSSPTPSGRLYASSDGLLHDPGESPVFSPAREWSWFGGQDGHWIEGDRTSQEARDAFNYDNMGDAERRYLAEKPRTKKCVWCHRENCTPFCLELMNNLDQKIGFGKYREKTWKTVDLKYLKAILRGGYYSPDARTSIEAAILWHETQKSSQMKL